jgi:Na+/H+-dicarboxylate symporter
MPLFQREQDLTEEERKLKVLTFWLFVVSVFAWVIPFTLLFVVGLMNQAVGQGGAFSVAFLPSLGTFAVTVLLCVVVYLVYRKTILKI